MTELRLAVELVPKPLWWANPRKLMGRTNWDKIRREAYAAYGHRCGICQAEGRLEAHEIWEYDDENLVQRLLGLIALCPLCHGIKHIGRSGIQAQEGALDIQVLINHFVKVNECSKEAFHEHVATAFQVWRKRSRHESWNLDWGPYQGLVQS